jgi:DNA-directed RNA polymerase specialized sigma24 family protein
MMDIFLAQRAKLRRIAAGMGLGPSDVDDVLQDVSIKALEGPEGLDTKEQSARWLIRVTINRCITEHRPACFRPGFMRTRLSFIPCIT